MNDFNVLIVEDNLRFSAELSATLQTIGIPESAIKCTESYDDARDAINSVSTYDLAVIDLRIKSNQTHKDEPGMDLLTDVKNSLHNKNCSVIVLSEFMNPERSRTAFKENGAYDALEKSKFNNLTFPNVVRSALLRARVKQAETRAEERYRLIVYSANDSFIRAELAGPGIKTYYRSSHPRPFDANDWSRRVDNLQLQIQAPQLGDWRKEARSIGQAIHKAIQDEPEIFQALTVAQMGKRVGDLWLEWRGTASSLSIPFELLHQHEFIAQKYLVTRRVDNIPAYGERTQAWREFMSRFEHGSKELRILLVVDGRSDLPSARAEGEELQGALKSILPIFGIKPNIKMLLGYETLHSNVVKAFREHSPHIFHYAGHSDFDSNTPEKSPLLLADRDLETSALKTLAEDAPELRLAFLSSCLSARAGAPGYGDFHGFFETLTQVGVPTVLGYRWEVNDSSAKALALSFYRNLWLTLCPAEALWQARREFTFQSQGLNDETWASLVLLMQNP
jgi:DNA-binding response OmpR family regulator